VHSRFSGIVAGVPTCECGRSWGESERTPCCMCPDTGCVGPGWFYCKRCYSILAERTFNTQCLSVRGHGAAPTVAESEVRGIPLSTFGGDETTLPKTIAINSDSVPNPGERMPAISSGQVQVPGQAETSAINSSEDIFSSLPAADRVDSNGGAVGLDRPRGRPERGLARSVSQYSSGFGSSTTLSEFAEEEHPAPIDQRDELLWYIRTCMAGMPRTTDSINFLKRKAEGWRAKNCPNMSEKDWHFCVANAIKAYSGGEIDVMLNSMMVTERTVGIRRINLLMDGCITRPLSLFERAVSASYSYWRGFKFASAVLNVGREVFESSSGGTSAIITPNQLVGTGLVVSKALYPATFVAKRISARLAASSTFLRSSILSLGVAWVIAGIISRFPPAWKVRDWALERSYGTPKRILPKPQ
jgi:hypothetical protein